MNHGCQLAIFTTLHGQRFLFLESSCPWFRTIRTSKHLGLSACYQRQVDVVSLCQSLNLDSGLPALCWSLCGIGGSSLARACWFQREKPPEIGYKCVSSCCCDSPQDMCGYSCKGVSWFVSLCEPVCVLVPYKVPPALFHFPDLAFDRRKTPLATPCPTHLSISGKWIQSI